MGNPTHDEKFEPQPLTQLISWTVIVSVYVVNAVQNFMCNIATKQEHGYLSTANADVFFSSRNLNQATTLFSNLSLPHFETFVIKLQKHHRRRSLTVVFSELVFETIKD